MNIQEIHKIYNGFEIKDMPRHEFVKQMQNLTSQSGVQQDLKKIMDRKRTESRKRMEIDRAIEDAR